MGDFNASYLDQRNVRGGFAKDTVTINGRSIRNQKLGLIRSQTPGTGLLGLGLSEGVAAAEKYHTVVDNLVTEGHIERAAFSLFLNRSSSSSNVTGIILFGGIDTEKYMGNLATLPLVPGFKPGAGVVAYAVHTSGLALDKDNGQDLTFLLNEYVKPVWDNLGVEIAQKRAFIDCKYTEDEGRDVTVDVAFPNKMNNVPLRKLVVDTGNPGLLKLLGLKLEPPCIFGLQGTSANNSTGNRFVIVGSNVLRSAHVVYNATNKQVGIIQANVGSTSCNIVGLKAGTDSPAVTGANANQTNNQPRSEGNSAGDMVTRRCVWTVAIILSTVVFPDI
ncbi:eukaryotic aspartyl protease, partial [Metarhizium brunneum ARSEF 3297]